MVWDVFLNRVLERSKKQFIKKCWGKNERSRWSREELEGAGGAGRGRRSWQEPAGAGRSWQEPAGADGVGRSAQELEDRVLSICIKLRVQKVFENVVCVFWSARAGRSSLVSKRIV